MVPTLRGGDYFVARVNPYKSKNPARDDVVLFPYPWDRSKLFVKRIVGLEGERLEIRDKQLFVNDMPLDEPWVVHCLPPSCLGTRAPETTLARLSYRRELFSC